MPDSKIIFPYRAYRKTTVSFLLLLMTIGAAGSVFVGRYLYQGGRLELNGSVLLHDKSGAMVMWAFTGVAIFAMAATFASWLAIKRRRPCVVLEEDAVTVPDKWRMKPTRIPIENITRIVWSKKAFGKVGYLWLWNKDVKMVIIEDLLERGAIPIIVDWIQTQQQAKFQPAGQPRQ